VLFIGTQFSNLYTAVDTPARGRVGASEEQARQLSSNLNALGVLVMIGTAHRHSFSGYFSGAENASSSAGNLGGSE
jgi:hypothetical protein